MGIAIKLLKFLGRFLVASGLLMLSPFADFLPVDLWPKVVQLFSAGDSNYIKIVPSSGTNFFPYVFILLGAIFLFIGFKIQVKKA